MAIHHCMVNCCKLHVMYGDCEYDYETTIILGMQTRVYLMGGGGYSEPCPLNSTM